MTRGRGAPSKPKTLCATREEKAAAEPHAGLTTLQQRRKTRRAPWTKWWRFWPGICLVALAAVHEPWVALRTSDPAEDADFWVTRAAALGLHILTCCTIVSTASEAWPVRSFCALALAINRNTVAHVRQAGLAEAVVLSLCSVGVYVLLDEALAKPLQARFLQESRGLAGRGSIVALVAAMDVVKVGLHGVLLQAPSDGCTAYFRALRYGGTCLLAGLLARLCDSMYWHTREPADFIRLAEQELRNTGKLKSLDRAYEALTRIRGVGVDNRAGLAATIVLLAVCANSVSWEIRASRTAAMWADPLLAWNQTMAAAELELARSGLADGGASVLRLLPDTVGRDARAARRYCKAKLAALARDLESVEAGSRKDAILACGACVQDSAQWNATCATAMTPDLVVNASRTSTPWSVFEDGALAKQAAQAVCRACAASTRDESTPSLEETLWVVAANRAIRARDPILARSCCKAAGENEVSDDWLEQADALGRAGLLQEAIVVVEQGLAQNASSTMGWLRLGQLNAAAGRLASAELAYRKGLRRDDQDAALHTHAALAASQRGRVEDARTSFERAFRIHVNRGELEAAASVYADLCYAYLFNEVLEEAAACTIPHEVASHYTPASLFNHRGIALARLEDAASAAEAFQQAKVRSWVLLASESPVYSPTAHADAFNNLGTLAWNEQRTIEARALFEAALEVQSDHAHAAQNVRKLSEALSPRPII